MRASPVTLGIEAWVRLLGQVVWVERRCFEVLGGWVAAESDRGAKLLLGRQYAHHAFHAELVEGVLPELRAGGAEEAVAPSKPAVTRLFGALADLDRPDQTVERLTAAYRVLLPAKVAAYEALRSRTTAVAEAPVARVLRLVLVDEGDDLALGEAMLRSVLATGSFDAATRAERTQGALDALLREAGGILGPVG